MGIWEWLRRAAMAVRRCKPRVKPVTDVYKKGLDVSRAAKFKVDTAVMSTAREIHDFISDDQVRDHVSGLLRHFSKNGALFIVRFYGGGPIIDIVSQSMQDRRSDSQMERLEELELKIAKLQWELHSIRTLGLAEISRKEAQLKYHSLAADMNPKQEAVLRQYLMKHLVVKFLNDPIVRRIRPGTGRHMKRVSDGDPHD